MFLKNCLKKLAILKTHLQVRYGSTNLKAILAEKIPQEQKRVLEFRKKKGNTKVGEVTVNMIYGGMRGLKAMIYETSVVDPVKGITFRGYSIPECRKKLPKAEGGEEPLPEGLFWLLLTGDIPSKAQANALSKEWAKRSFLPDYVKKMLNNLPKSVHPMAQLTSACTILNTESQFKAAYNKGVHKSKFWEYCFEDCMDLIAKVTSIAAIIYLNTYRGGSSALGGVSPDRDWAGNFTNMLGYQNVKFTELMRLYLVLHCDHEGGNVSAHTTTLVASALSDPYLAYAAGMNGLAGPLHGLANQEVVIWLQEIRKQLGDRPSNEKVKEFVWKTLKSGRVVPGYGHAVLRATDPRYTCQREFAEKHTKNDPLLDLVKQIYEIVPPILKELGKVQNPWPNVDAHSGALLMHFGMTEMMYYTVLFAISRALGVLANMIWARALGLPIERPKSISTNDLMKLVGAK